ncbi:MAG: NAD-binding protein [Deltaproteobacteria bacterium]|nr:NAD-binding protein [Deltaproteobacteria bacterium]
MKFLTTQFAYLLRESSARRNLKLLGKLILLMMAMIAVWAVLFHIIMARVEGQEHTWFTGVYWTLTVMTTLGFGDITFHTDTGRLFSSMVLISGVVFMLMVMPFTFIRFFYAPWIDAQVRLRVPRKAREEIKDHVILAQYDVIARNFITELKSLGVPYVLLESDPKRATDLHTDGLSVVTGDFDSRETLKAMRASQSRMLVANLDDASNSNLILTFRELAKTVPVVALVEERDSIDVLELSGADHVIPLKHRLGQQLASRVPAGRASTIVVGRFHQLLLAELAVHDTPLSGQRIRDTRIREQTGLNIVALQEAGRFSPAQPDMVLSPKTVVALLGTQEQLDSFDARLELHSRQGESTVVLGGGKVGRAVCRELRGRGVRVQLVEKDETLAPRLRNIADGVHFGDAADRDVLMASGLSEAPAVVLTTNDDAINIYLSIYCRRLNPKLRIVSRITHARNVDSIYRAGADFVLSSSTLAVQSLTAALLERELVILGVGATVIEIAVPEGLTGRSLAESRIGERTGLNVIAVQSSMSEVTAARPDLVLQEGSRLIMIGTADQLGKFRDL